MGRLPITEVTDLPRVEDVYLVHRTAGLYFVSTRGRQVAHGEIDCMHLDGVDLAASHWRVATDAQVRELGLGWCESCCGV